MVGTKTIVTSASTLHRHFKDTKKRAASMQ